MSTTASDLHRLFGSLLIQIARGYRRQLDRELAEISLSHASGLAVMLLGRMEDGVRQGALADRLGVEGPTVVPLIDQMERAGLVNRRADETDKRVRTLHLTDTGKALAEKAEERSTRIRSDLFSDIAEQDLQIAIDVLVRLQANIAARAGQS